MKEKVLVLGGGGREHVFGWSLAKSKNILVFTAPGNAGTNAIGKNIELDPEDVEKTAAYADEIKPILTVVGPEGPLAKGIVDAFKERKLPIFGPTEKAAQLETSKIWARKFMARHGIPSPEFAAFSDYRKAREYIENYGKYGRPCVVKPDGLTGGKGVRVCDTKEEALLALDETVKKYGEKVLIEERLFGQEASVLAIAGLTSLGDPAVKPLLPAEDYKQLYDRDEGPMTGGMGGVCPHWDTVSPTDLVNITKKILGPIVAGMADEGLPYTGILYAGLMKTKDGFKVLEINCRGGDPEMQVILPLLNTPLLPVLTAATKGKLDKIPKLSWKNQFALGVVLASEGYPGTPKIGREIFGINASPNLPKDMLIFQAGTKEAKDDGGKTLTSSGRVLITVGLGASVEKSGDTVYPMLATKEEIERGNVNSGKIWFEGNYFRTDIGQRGKPRNL